MAGLFSPFLSLWMKGFCQAWVESGRNIRTKPLLLAWWRERENIQYMHPVKPSLVHNAFEVSKLLGCTEQIVGTMHCNLRAKKLVWRTENEWLQGKYLNLGFTAYLTGDGSRNLEGRLLSFFHLKFIVFGQNEKELQNENVTLKEPFLVLQPHLTLAL